MTRRFVVEADGGSRGNPGPAAYGALVRDVDTGEVLAQRAETIGVATNNVAEYRGALAGLEAAAQLDPGAEVEVRMDSKLVVEQMAGRWRVKHPAMQPLALATRAAYPPERVSWTWVPRAENSRADALVNRALDGKPVPGVLATSARPALDDAEDPLDLPAAPERDVDRPDESPPPGWRPDLEQPTVLLLLRHGETRHTSARRFSGRGGDDPGLTAAGLAQARAAAASLVGRGVTAVVSSPLRRTRETADAVASVLDLPVRVEDDLAECAFGDWDGLTYDEVAERWPQDMQSWLWRTDVSPPGGESIDDVARRAARARDKIVARYSRRTVAVVSHVTPVKSLVRLALEAPPTAVFRLALLPASISEVHYWDAGMASLRSYNSVAHLA